MFNSIIREDIIYIANEIDSNYFRNKTILISGASGFLPSYLVEYFMYLNEINLDQNTKVVCLSRDLNKAKQRFSHLSENSLLEIFKHDVNDFFGYKGKIDFVIHAASQASPKYFGVDPVGTLTANTIGTSNLLSLSKEKKIESFLYFSSSEVYGAKNEFNQTKIEEKQYGIIDPLKLRSCYSMGKKMGENICISWAEQYDVNVKIVRPFHTYGPRMQLDDGRVFADFVRDALYNKTLSINSDGTAVRSYCYVRDATIGFLKILLFGENKQAYNLGNDKESYSIRELAEIVIKSSGKKLKFEYNSPTNENYLKSPINKYTPSIEKLKKLGFSPRVSAYEGFKRTINSYE